MSASPGDSGALVQVLTAVGGVVLGALSTVFGVYRSLQHQINALKDDQQAVSATSRKDGQESIDKIWLAIDALRQEMTADRRLAATDRANIAAMMVTRAELDRQVDRLIQTLGHSAE